MPTESYEYEKFEIVPPPPVFERLESRFRESYVTLPGARFAPSAVLDVQKVDAASAGFATWKGLIMIGLAKAGSTNKSMAMNRLTIFNDLDMRIFYHTKAMGKKRKAKDIAGRDWCIMSDVKMTLFYPHG